MSPFSRVLPLVLVSLTAFLSTRALLLLLLTTLPMSYVSARRFNHVLNRVVVSLNPWCMVLSVVLVLRTCVRAARLRVLLVLLSRLLNDGRIVAVRVLSSDDASTFVSSTSPGRGAAGLVPVGTLSTTPNRCMYLGHSASVALAGRLTAKDSARQSRLVNCNPIASA